METFRARGEDIFELIHTDFMKVNENGQTELWKNHTIVAVFTKDVSVYKIV